MPSLLPVVDDDVEPQLSQHSEYRWGSYAAVVLAGWLLLLALLAGIGALLVGPLVGSGLLQWDQKYPVDVEEVRTAAGESWSHVGSAMGETLTVVGVAFVIGIGLLIARRWASVMLLATALLVEVSVFVTTTILVPRDRPDVEQLDASPPTSSFPSGHTAASTALALSLAVLVSWNVRSTALRWLAWTLAVLVGPIVALSRVYRGMHHPTDVAAGLLLGAGCVVLAFLAVRAWLGTHSAEDDPRASMRTEENAR